MDAKPKVSPGATYVFQEEDIEAYDHLSLTCAMRDASAIIKKKLDEATGEGEASMEDVEFDKLLSGD